MADSADDVLKIRNAGDVVSNIDDYLNSSRKPFITGMSADDAARYNTYWDSLGNGTHTLPNMNAEDFARFQNGIDRLDAVYADRILADSADDILKIRNAGDVVSNIDDYLNSSRKPFITGMSADDAAKYNKFWDSNYSVDDLLKTYNISLDEFNRLKLTDVNSLSASEVSKMKAIREAVPKIDETTLIQKTIPECNIEKYLGDRGYSTIGGYIAKYDDVSHISGYDNVVESSRLDYVTKDGTRPYPENGYT